MLREILIVIEGEPQGKNRPRFAVRGKGARQFVQVYTDEATKEYEARIAREGLLAMSGMPPIDGGVGVELKMLHSIRQSWTKKKKELASLNKIVPTLKVDADNCLKVFCDALNGIAWKDDVQVVEVKITKQFSETPCVLFRIYELGVDGV